MKLKEITKEMLAFEYTGMKSTSLVKEDFLAYRTLDVSNINDEFVCLTLGNANKHNGVIDFDDSERTEIIFNNLDEINALIKALNKAKKGLSK